MKYIITIISFLTVISCHSNLENTQRPNVIFIMSDDHAEKAISCYGHHLLETPNIDRIAEGGIRFENSFVTNSICAPSRAVILTGRYSHLNGLRDNRDQFDGSQVTFPKLLQREGYSTAIVGKWHLKTTPTGFDYWNILINQGDYYNPRMIEMGDTMVHTGYTTDLITDFALDYLKERSDLSQPFCLMLHHKAPHRNWMPPPRYFNLLEDREIEMPANYFDDYNGRIAAANQDMRIDNMFMSLDMKLHPLNYEGKTGSGGGPEGFVDANAWANAYGRMNNEQKAIWDAHYDPINQSFKEAQLEGRALSQWKFRRYMEDYLGSVAAVDDNIGRVLDFLDQSGLADNTLVIYTSDQGFYLGEHGWYDKRFMYEESLSMPLVMKYPGQIKPRQVNQEIVLNLDLAPTILDFAGVPVPQEFQGRSLKPLVKNIPVEWRHAMYYEYFEYPHGWHSVRQHYGIRTDKFKLIHFFNNPDHWELYDLENDIEEMNNLYNNSAYSQIKKALHQELEGLRKKYLVEEI